MSKSSNFNSHVDSSQPMFMYGHVVNQLKASIQSREVTMGGALFVCPGLPSDMDAKHDCELGKKQKIIEKLLNYLVNINRSRSSLPLKSGFSSL